MAVPFPVLHFLDSVPVRVVPIDQGVYVATAFPFEARNTAYERPFIVSTLKLAGEPFMVSELSCPPVI